MGPQALLEHEPKPIRPLSDRTAALLQATQLLPSLPATLSHLLQHLLDLSPPAQAVTITLDAARWGFSLHLDGPGLEHPAFERLAVDESGLGLVGRVALLEVDSSDRHGAQRTYLVKGGRVLHQGLSAAALRSPGTTLTVKDLFYNVPVRRASAPLPATLHARCLRLVEQLSVARFDLGFRVFEARREESIWRVKQASDAKERFAQIHGPSLLLHPTPISSSSSDLFLTGFISTAASHSTSHSYISINHRPLPYPSALHDTIAALFALSSFASRAQALTDPGLSGSSPAMFDRGVGNERSPRKAVRRPVYVLELGVPEEQVLREGGEADGVQFEDWPRVRKLVEAAVRAFLEQHGLLKPPSSTGTFTSPEKRRLAFSCDGGGMSVKRSRVGSSPLKEVITPEPADTSVVSYRDPTTKKVWQIDRQTGHSQVLGERRLGGTKVAAGGKQETPEWLRDVLQTWKNPAFPVATEPPIHSSVTQTSAANTSLPFYAVTSASLTSFPSGDIHAALQHAQVLSQVDSKFIACRLNLPRTPSLLTSGNAGELPTSPYFFLVDQHAADERVRVERYLRELGEGFLENCRRGRLKTNLQLDGIPVVEPEREAFILLTAAEHRTLATSPATQLALARWGISFNLAPPAALSALPDAGDPPVQVRIAALPALVADRLLGRRHLREGPAELTELVKAFLAKLADEPGGAEAVCKAAEGRAGDGKDRDWMGAMRFCPGEMLELVDSKACRGATMFNDRLTSGQAQDLIHQLAQTRLPLQCAHGRPSMSLVADVQALHRRSVRNVQARKAVDWRALMD